MSRLMSVSLTEQAVRDRTKTVTRRLGWRFLKPGDTLTLCRKDLAGRVAKYRGVVAFDFTDDADRPRSRT